MREKDSMREKERREAGVVKFGVWNWEKFGM
jgi:hypothetical protein